MANTILHWSRISSFWSKTPRLEKTHAFINDFDHIPWEDTPDFPKQAQRKTLFQVSGSFWYLPRGALYFWSWTLPLEREVFRTSPLWHPRCCFWPGSWHDHNGPWRRRCAQQEPSESSSGGSRSLDERWEKNIKNKLQMDRWIFRSPRETPVVAVRKWGQITHLRNIIGITNFCTFFSNGNLDRTKKQLIFPGLGIGLLTISCFSCWYPIYAMCPLQVSTNNYPFQQISAYFLIVHWFCNMFTLTPFGMIQFEEHVFPYWNHSIFCVCLQWMVSLRFATWFFPFRILVSRQNHQKPFTTFSACEYIILTIYCIDL